MGRTVCGPIFNRILSVLSILFPLVTQATSSQKNKYAYYAVQIKNKDFFFILISRNIVWNKWRV